MRTQKIPILSFFTGGGFLDLGFEETGFQSVWTNEYNCDIADMYEHAMTTVRYDRDPNAPTARISSRASIEKLRSEEIIEKTFDGKAPDIYGVIGGPPCPDFSVGGKNKGYQGDQGKLSQCFADIICQIKPTFFLMENVPGLLRTTKHRVFFENLRRQFHQSHYATDMKILNALEYGVPQYRERLFLVGIDSAIIGKLGLFTKSGKAEGWFPFPTKTFPDALSLPWPRASAFGMEPAKPPGIDESLTVYPLLSSTPPPSELPNGDENFIAYSNKFETIAEGDDSGKSFKRLHRYRYSPTVCYGNNEVHLHPWKPRRLTVREALRIQGMPDSYILPKEKNLSIKFKMIGNGVPRVLAREMAFSLKKTLA